MPGSAYLVLGGADSGATHAISAAAQMVNEYDYLWAGTRNSDLVGMAVSFGDFNADGYDEVVLGSGIHKAFVFEGLLNIGTPRNETVTSAAVATIDGSADARFAGLQFARFGDVNDDGFEDLAVTAPGQLWYEDGPSRTEGELFFFHGGAME